MFEISISSHFNWKQLWNIKMSLEIDYERPYQRTEPESLQSFIKIVWYNIKSMHPT